MKTLRKELEKFYINGDFKKINMIFQENIRQKKVSFELINQWMSICSATGVARVADSYQKFYRYCTAREKAIIDSYLAVDMWLTGDLIGLGNLFGAAKGRFAQEGSRREDLIAIAHMKLIARLVNERVKNTNIYENDKTVGYLDVLGDSHSVVLANSLVSWGGNLKKIQSHPIRGLKLFHLGLDRKDDYRKFFKERIEKIERKEVIISAGEIDLRANEGIFQYCKKNNIQNTIGQALITFDVAAKYISTYKNKKIYLLGPNFPIYDIQKYIPGREREFAEFFERSERLLEATFQKHGINYIKNVNQYNANEFGHQSLDDLHMKPIFYQKIADRVSRKQIKGDSMSDEQKVTIDGTSYPISDMSEEAKEQLNNLRAVDQEIQRLKMQLAIAQTARLAYGKALKSELDGSERTGPPIEI